MKGRAEKRSVLKWRFNRKKKNRSKTKKLNGKRNVKDKGKQKRRRGDI